ncbi:hypothetical protein [Pedobacter miscanthi]|uniref:Uncharacterized protein n=1 Tax=Pedobacter miscanthi TaxID=2259170 RepID=A0A366L465_9SPHI|nr:hypothetical protein [Pedobacter miscanthi]RBQ08681.1 hypothetical protein DRW42_08210 [Pedobacter miscanthi]
MIGLLFNIVQGLDTTVKVVNYMLPENHGTRLPPIDANPFLDGALDNVVHCYESHKNLNFGFEHTITKLKALNQDDFIIMKALKCEYCLYLIVYYLDVFDRTNKLGETKEARNKMITYFSINYLQANNNVIIYGCKASNDRMQQIHKNIGSQLYLATI